MIAIIDYGVGNLFSLTASLKYLDADAIVTNKAEDIEKADRIILPGVGAFEDAIAKLKATGLVDTIIEQTKKGKPLLGICLGMQLLFEESHEYGVHKGLGLVKGTIASIDEDLEAAGIEGLKVPHIGWNALSIKKNSRLFKYIKDGDYVYLVHSYHGVGCISDTTSVTDYGAPLTASVEKDNVFGCQFHPEKSGEVGLSILKAFVEI